MESSKSEEYLPDKQGEYVHEMGTSNLSVQGLSDTLTALETEVMEAQLHPVEFTLQLEVMMADLLGCPCPPTFSWNVGMVMHVLKSDPTLRDLEHVQVDGLGMAYLFFFGKQGQWGLTHKATQAIQMYVGEAFMEWISHSAHFAMNPLPLAEGWHCTVTALEWHRHQSWAEYLGPAVVPMLASSESEEAVKLKAPHSCMLGHAYFKVNWS